MAYLIRTKIEKKGFLIFSLYPFNLTASGRRIEDFIAGRRPRNSVDF